MSQKTPYLGGSLNINFIYTLNLSILFMSSIVFISGEIPPCKAKNLEFTMQAIGMLSKESIMYS